MLHAFVVHLTRDSVQLVGQMTYLTHSHHALFRLMRAGSLLDLSRLTVFWFFNIVAELRWDISLQLLFGSIVIFTRQVFDDLFSQVLTAYFTVFKLIQHVASFGPHVSKFGCHGAVRLVPVKLARNFLATLTLLDHRTWPLIVVNDFLLSILGFTLLFSWL